MDGLFAVKEAGLRDVKERLYPVTVAHVLYTVMVFLVGDHGVSLWIHLVPLDLPRIRRGSCCQCLSTGDRSADVTRVTNRVNFRLCE